MLEELIKSLLSSAASGAAPIDPDMVRTPSETGGDAAGPKDEVGVGQFFKMLQSKPDTNTITNDDGSFSLDQSNPFLDAIKKSRSGNDTGPGVLKQFLDGMIGNPTNVGSATSTSDVVMNPTPIAKQKQEDFTAVSPTVPIPQPRPPQANYAQPSALDPVGIEQLRQSLLTQAGQLDPGNPNGLSGRMNSPNSQSDMGLQRNEAMSIEDSIRGFDGGPKPRRQSDAGSPFQMAGEIAQGGGLAGPSDFVKSWNTGETKKLSLDGKSPEEFMKNRPDDEEGLPLSDKEILIRKKQGPAMSGDQTPYQVADVTPLHPPGTFSRNTQGGDVLNGVASSLGIRPPQNIIPFPNRRS